MSEFEDLRNRLMDQATRNCGLAAELVRAEGERDALKIELTTVIAQVAVMRGPLAESMTFGNAYYNPDVSAFRDRVCAALAGNVGRALQHEMTALKKVEKAARTECAKFRFPEEDRPELHEALIDLDKIRGEVAR